MPSESHVHKTPLLILPPHLAPPPSPPPSTHARFKGANHVAGPPRRWGCHICGAGRGVGAVQTELEEELDGEAAAGGWLSDPAQLDRYAALKLEADSRTSRLVSERSTAATKLQARSSVSCFPYMQIVSHGGPILQPSRRRHALKLT